MKTYQLNGQKRVLVGRKVKTLRRQGLVPGTIYGKNIQSVNVAISGADFSAVFQRAGETGVIELSIDKAVHPVLVHNVQKDPVTDAVVHVEFYQVDLHEKVHANVPLSFVGEAPAVAEKKGVLLTLVSEIEVEALPTDLPDKIDVDVSGLAEVDQELTVAALRVPSGVSVSSEKDVVVVKVGSLVSKEAEEQAAAEAQAAAAAAAPTEEAGEQPKEQAEKQEEKPAEKTVEPKAEEKK